MKKVEDNSMDKENFKAICELLEKVPEEDLEKAVGGLTNHQRKILFGVGGALVTIGSIFAIRRLMGHGKDSTVSGVGLVGKDGKPVYYYMSKEECLKWMKQRKLKSNRTWAKETAIEYIKAGGDIDLMPTITRNNYKNYWKDQK